MNNQLLEMLQSEVNRLTGEEKQIVFALKKLRTTIKALSSPKFTITSVNVNGNHRKKFSAAVRHRMAEAQRLRWQKVFAAKRKKAAA